MVMSAEEKRAKVAARVAAHRAKKKEQQEGSATPATAPGSGNGGTSVKLPPPAAGGDGRVVTIVLPRVVSEGDAKRLGEALQAFINNGKPGELLRLMHW